MKNISIKTVSEMTNLLHICLAKAIDMAMTEKSGQGWFEVFKDYDSKQNDPILENTHTSVSKMDLQACLKFLRFRDDYSNIVFEYFGYNFFDQSDDAKIAKLLMTRLLDSLIHNVRNRLLAHASTNMVEGGKDDDMRFSIYGPKEAANDCIRLAQVFARVTDESGVSYYTKLVKLSETKQGYSIPEVIRNESLPLSAGSFVDICNINKIPVVTGENGEMFFISSNYDGDIAKIKLYISQNFKNQKTYAIADIISTENLAISSGNFVEVCQAIGISVSTADGELRFFSNNYEGDIARIKLYLNESSPETQKKGLPKHWKAIAIILSITLVFMATVAVIWSIKRNDKPETTTEEAAPIRINGQTNHSGVTFTIDQELKNNQFIVNISNEGYYVCRVGWIDVTNCEFTLEAVSGKTYESTTASLSIADDETDGLRNDLNPGDKAEICIFFSDDITEDIKSITLNGIYLTYEQNEPGEYFPWEIPVTINIEYVE